MSTVAAEAARRRTFAIISHPDAGKTTLTEKLLLYSGSIHLAGSIRARKTARHAVSDWMKMEQERGISITSSVLQFEHLGGAMNLVDTPGHADFSEDTFRTLAAVDSALMLIDHTKGVEARTRRLFEVCRMRQLPIVTFMNKLDRLGLDPLGLIDEVSETLDLQVVPMNWPIGQGTDFRGVVDVQTGRVFLFSGGEHGSERVNVDERDCLADAVDVLGQSVVDETGEQVELVQMAGAEWSLEGFLAGDVSPAFWGSAMSNYGVEPVLDFLARTAPPPHPRNALSGDAMVEVPTDAPFSAFVFKIQANMNPRHRDRVAFLRVASGHFERGMDAQLGRTGENIRLAKPHTFMAGERSVTEEAWPGDIVGLYDPGKLRIGDTLSAGDRLKFSGIPRFAPEHFARVVLKDPMKRKQLDNGLRQLAHEGVIQVFVKPDVGRQDPVLGAVGLLQFEVLKERLKNEYRVNVQLMTQDFRLARWVGGDPAALDWFRGRRDFSLVEDRHGQKVLLVAAPWALTFALREAKGLELSDVEPL